MLPPAVFRSAAVLGTSWLRGGGGGGSVTVQIVFIFIVNLSPFSNNSMNEDYLF